MDEEKDLKDVDNGNNGNGENTGNGGVNAEGEAKKQGKVSGFFRSLGSKIGDATYDMRAESNFNSTHAAYTVYTGNGLMQHTAALHAEEHDGYIVALGQDDRIAAGHVIVREKDGAASYVAAVEKTTLSFEFEGRQNEKNAMKITVGEPAEKVEVIKAGENFYLKK